MGRALPGVHVTILDEHGEQAASGVPGEVAIDGPVVMREYWNRPEATAESRQGPWFMAGDIGQMDEDGDRLGEEIAAVITPGMSIDADELRGWLTERLAGYKVPQVSDRRCAAQGCDGQDPEAEHRHGRVVRLGCASVSSPVGRGCQRPPSTSMGTGFSTG